jgi:hypothetical protein
MPSYIVEEISDFANYRNFLRTLKCYLYTAVKVLSLTLTTHPNFDHCCFFLLKMHTTDYNDCESNIFIAFHYFMLVNFKIMFFT